MNGDSQSRKAAQPIKLLITFQLSPIGVDRYRPFLMSLRPRAEHSSPASQAREEANVTDFTNG